MSNTYKHKDLGRWKNASGNITDRLNNLFDRHNFDVGERKAKKIALKEKKLSKIDQDEISNYYPMFDCGVFMYYI